MNSNLCFYFRKLNNQSGAHEELLVDIFNKKWDWSELETWKHNFFLHRYKKLFFNNFCRTVVEWNLDDNVMKKKYAGFIFTFSVHLCVHPSVNPFWKNGRMKHRVWEEWVGWVVSLRRLDQVDYIHFLALNFMCLVSHTILISNPRNSVHWTCFCFMEKLKKII